ncbi:hypothetical protein [Crossiella sp. NPDC003009]
MLGLPELPVIGQRSKSSSNHSSGQAWARDEFLAAREGIPTELVRVNPRTGLTAAEFEHAEAWLTGC